MSTPERPPEAPHPMAASRPPMDGGSAAPATPTGFWSPRRVAWAGGLLVAAFAAQGIHDMVRGYFGTLEETRHALESQSRVIAEQTARSLQALDTVLRHLVEQHRRGVLDRLDPASLHAYLNEQAVGLVQIDGLVLFDAKGQGVASSIVPPAEIHSVNVAQMSVFQRLREDRDTELAVGTTFRSANTGRHVFPIGRRLEGPDGEFLGVAGAGGLVDYFQRFYRDAYPEAGIRIALLHRDTTLLARHPPADAALGRKVPLVEELMAAAEAGEIMKRHPSPLDGIDRFGATRLVPGYPLVIVVTRDAASVFAGWRQQAVGSVLRTLGLGALAVALIVTVMRQLSRLAAARGSLATSESRYALAAAGSDTGVWDWDMVAGTAYESRRARELQGLPLEPENQSLQELEGTLRVHPDDAPRRAAALQAHLASKTPHYEIEYRVLRPDGNYYWVHCRALCIRDAAGKPLRIAGSVADIDARKRAEVALLESEERFAAAVAGSDDGIFMRDLVHGRAFASTRAQQLTGLVPGPEVQPLQEHLDRAARQIHPDDLARREEAMARHLAGETPAYVVEFRVRQPDGNYRWVHVHGKCVRDLDGKPLRIAGSISDIDARKRAEEELRQSEERYALAMVGSSGGHWVWDTGSDLLFVSGKVHELFGVATDCQWSTRAEFFALVALDPDERERLAAIETNLLSGRIERASYEFRILLPEGERWILTRAQRFETEQSLRIAGVSVDISERKRADAERQRLEEQLRQAQKLEAIGTLAGGIAHDFNNILSAILGYGELAQKGAVEGTDQWRHLEAAMAAGQRAKSLVERILAFSRSGIGERAPVHVQSVVSEALDAVAGGAPPGIRLTRRIAAGDAGVLGDPTQIHQVVMNLCANAIQAMRSEGHLEVALDVIRLDAPLAVATSTLPSGSFLRLVVTDNGSGIAPGVQARIFDPFFTTKEVGVGTGLGLSLVHGIVTDLGGGIAVESEEGVGSRFTVYLPSCAPVASPSTERFAAPHQRGDGQTIMLVDDEESLVRLGEETLAGLGYEPVGFTSPRAALDALAAEPGRFDALLSDEAMPGLTGSQLAREALALAPRLPIILMSGYVTPALVERAAGMGLVEVLAKPLTERAVARALAAALAAGSRPARAA